MREDPTHLSDHSVGDVGLHGGDVFLRVVDGDEEVTCFSIQVVIQLQPVQEGGRGGGTRCLHRRPIGQNLVLEAGNMKTIETA